MALDLIPIDGNTHVDQGNYLRHLSKGTVLHSHDPLDLFSELKPIWKSGTQMVQVAKGHKWCCTCGDVRPYSYFDKDPSTHDGYSKECRQCVNSRDPKLAKEKYCSACKVMHPRDDFADDDSRADGKYPMCIAGKKRYDAARYAQKKWVNQGRLPGSWGGRRTQVSA